MDNNPLKQYFRRPAVYIRLPSKGLDYPAGSLEMPENGELPVYPMTAIDEITSRTPDGLYNGAAVVEIIKSCIPNIKNPWHISALDLDTVLLSIRAASGDGKLDVQTTCEKCENQDEYKIDIPALLANLSSGNYNEELALNDLLIKFKPIKFLEINQAALTQFEVSKSISKVSEASSKEEIMQVSQTALKAITELTMQIVAKGIEYIKTPTHVVTNSEYILDFLSNCDKNTYIAIRDYSTDLKAKSEIKPMQITCTNCNHQFEQKLTLNPSDFFG